MIGETVKLEKQTRTNVGNSTKQKVSQNQGWKKNSKVITKHDSYLRFNCQREFMVIVWPSFEIWWD
jgi:hypothetical protein